MSFLAIAALGLSLIITPGDGSPWSQAWRWHDEAGRDVQLRQWLGHPMVLTMFYRSCETRCPHTLQRLQRLSRAYAARGQEVNFVLVSLDPHNDKPAQLAAFKQSLGLPEVTWHLLVGDEPQTRELGVSLGIHATKDDDHIVHSTRILIYDSSGALAHEFSDWSFEDAAAAVQ